MQDDAGSTDKGPVDAEHISTEPISTVEELDEDHCWRLLEANDYGRLAVAIDSGVDIFPMNYTVRDRKIFVRSAPGSKMIDITERPSVAYQADGTADGRRWSVVVKGTAQRLGFDSEIEASGVLDLESESPTDKWNYVRIDPNTVTGRRFTSKRRSD